MPRNASGVYTLPAGNPVIPGTTIDAAWANDTLEDLANEVTNSLSRTGAGGMLAPFRIADGNITAPGISFLNETNTGLYRSGAGSAWMAVLGVNVAQFSTVGLTIASSKALTALGNGSVAGTFAVGGATTLASTLAVTGALTATGGVLGNITAGSGTSTFNNVVINGNLDMDAGSSGTITNLPNPTNPGDAANKAYVDSQDALRLALTGGTMTGVIAMSNNKVTGVATPTNDQDAANKAYVDTVAQGLDVKGSCRAATVANITLSGTQTIDGVAVIAGDRVLVKDQSTAANNGIYVVAAGSWSRSSDADTWAELVGAFTFVEDGTVNDNSGWVCTSAPGGTLGVTAVTFEQFSGAGQINAGQGLSKSGNTIQVNTASSSRIVIGADDIDLATTGVVANTYKSVTVDAYGRVTAGTNPTTLAGFGIGDAYTQTQTDTLLAAKLSLAGGTMSGAIAMGGNKITGLGDPTLAQDAATKNYIDTIFGSTSSAAASAAAAATSASNAASSASSASTSASNASSSASSAASSATAAAASYDSFDDRYLGAKASDPTVDNDGNPLLTGALYWNTTSNQMRVYDGSAWVVAYLPAAGYAQLAAANVFTANQTITANTSSDALKITQTGSGNALYIEDVASDATPFVVSSTGVMGIGTTTPDNVTSAGIALVSNSGYYPQLVQRNTTADGNASYVVLEKNRNGAIVQNGDVMGNLIFRGYDGASYLQGAFINAVVSATPGTNDMPTDLVFGTTPDGSAGPSERLRIASTGFGTATQDWSFQGVRVGRGAGAVSSNTAVGASALQANTTGLANTGLGNSALKSNTTASYSVAVGHRSLEASTGAENTSVGAFGLYLNTTGTMNAGLGGEALAANTTGSYNTSIGTQSLNSNTTASNNTAVGYQAGYSNQTGGEATFAGYKAGYASTASYNTAFGSNALAATTTGANNNAFGQGSLYSNTTGASNSAFGHQSLLANTTGTQNVALGSLALYTNTTASTNTAVGYYSMLYTTTGASNTAVGGDSLRTNTTGTQNAVLGSNAMYSNSTGNQNVAVGSAALYNNTTASSNNAIGYQAGFGLTTGYGNTLLGYAAANTLTVGSNNTFIGNSTAASSASVSNELVICSGSGYSGKGASTGFISPNGGGVYQGNNSSSWSTTSDERIKTNFKAVTNGLDVINALEPTEFDYIVTGKHDVGFRAQQYMTVLADQVTKHTASPEEKAIVGEDEIYGIQRNLDPYFVSAIKALTAQVEALKAEIATLKGN